MKFYTDSSVVLIYLKLSSTLLLTLFAAIKGTFWFTTTIKGKRRYMHQKNCLRWNEVTSVERWEKVGLSLVGDGIQTSLLFRGKAHNKRGRQYSIHIVGVDPNYGFIIDLTNLPKVLLLMVRVEEKQKDPRVYDYESPRLLYFLSLPQHLCSKSQRRHFLFITKRQK